MQRFGWALIALMPSLAAGQEAAGTALWRLAATTLPVPPALARGAAAVLWNPAQGAGESRLVAALELVHTPAALDGSGVLAAARWRVPRVGAVGLLYGRMQLGGLVRTSDSPAPDPGTIPYYSALVGVTWARSLARTELGGVLAYHDTRLDRAYGHRWTLDLGMRHHLTDGLRIAVATHFFSGLRADSPTQDVYAAGEYRFWRGPLWRGSGTAAVWGRYGMAFGHGFGADQFAGAGLELRDVLELDLLVTREGGYGEAGWRPAGGVRLGIGRYRLTFAGDGGANGLGSSYRVGLEAQIR